MAAREHRPTVRLSKQLPPPPLRIIAKPRALKAHGSLAGQDGVSHDLSNASRGRGRAKTEQNDCFTAVHTKMGRPSQQQPRGRHRGRQRRRHQDTVMTQSTRRLTRKTRARDMGGLSKLPHRAARRVRSSLSARARARAVSGTGQSSPIPEAPYESIPSRHLRPAVTLQKYI
jgi:hypothetical protein